MDKREKEILKKDEGYQSQFWAYLDKNFAIIAKNMIAKARSKARLPLTENGTPERCYTHQSESLNNMLTRRKESFIKTDKGKQDLSKLQFTTEVFQPTYKHQMQELKAALYGGSDEYELADVCKYLEVSPETWFGDWSEKQREEYIKKFNRLTMEQVMQGKPIKLVTNADNVASDTRGKEFVNVPSIVADKLKEKRGCSDELIQGLIQQVTTLVNSPYAIQRQPSLTETSKAKFLVASKTAKGGYYTCTLNKAHVSCVCSSYKYDSICKHSLAVSVKENIPESHMNNVRQGKR